MSVTVKKEVKCCSECPYFSAQSDMGARIEICSNIGILNFSKYNDSSNEINDNCPLLDDGGIEK